MNLTITSPSNGNFQFLESITVYIKADELEEKKIAWKENISESIGKSLELETSNIDLKEYIKKDSYQLKVTTVTDKTIASDHEIDISTTFFVDAKILGI